MSTATIPSYLKPVANGYIHSYKNINLRITSSNNIDPVLKAAKKWMNVDEIEQEIYAQSDEIWNTYEEKIKSAKTDLEIYSLLKSIPSSAISFKDLCNNNVAHRLILALKKHEPEIVDSIWYLLDDIIKPYMHLSNDFGHTPWELMGTVPSAFEKVLNAKGAEIFNLIPIRTWRKHPVYINAWNLATKEQRTRFARYCKSNNLDLLCYLTMCNPVEIKQLTRGNIILLEGCTEEIKNAYPDHKNYLLENLLEKNMHDQILTFTN